MSNNVATSTAPMGPGHGFIVFARVCVCVWLGSFSNPSPQADERNRNPSVVMIVSIRATIRATMLPPAVHQLAQGAHYVYLCVRVCVLVVKMGI